MHKFDVRVNENQTLECDIGIQRDNKLDITVDGSQLPSHDTVIQRDHISNIKVVRFFLDAVITVVNLVKRFFAKISHQFTLKISELSSLVVKFINALHESILMSSVSTVIRKFIQASYLTKIKKRLTATLNKFTGVKSEFNMLSDSIKAILGKLISGLSKFKLLSSSIYISFGKAAKIAHKFKLNTVSRISLIKFIKIPHVIGTMTSRRPRLLVEIDPLYLSDLDSIPLEDISYSNSVRAVLLKMAGLLSVLRIKSNVSSVIKKIAGVVSSFVMAFPPVATLVGKSISTKSDFILTNNAKGSLWKFVSTPLKHKLLNSANLLMKKYASLSQRKFELKATVEVVLRRYRRISEVDTVSISQLDSMAIEKINYIIV